jgi:hypothetical protein
VTPFPSILQLALPEFFKTAHTKLIPSLMILNILPVPPGVPGRTKPSQQARLIIVGSKCGGSAVPVFTPLDNFHVLGHDSPDAMPIDSTIDGGQNPLLTSGWTKTTLRQLKSPCETLYVV